MTLTDKDAQRRPWCMFGTLTSKVCIPARLIFVDESTAFPYVDEFLVAWQNCREFTPEELAEHGLTQPPRPTRDMFVGRIESISIAADITQPAAAESITQPPADGGEDFVKKLTDEDAKWRPYCKFQLVGGEWIGPAKLIYVACEDSPAPLYYNDYGDYFYGCRECTSEELAATGLTQPPRPWADRVTQWAIDRNIIGGTTPKDQFGKLEEEVEELRDAIYSDNIREIVDAIGDCSVVLTIIAAQYGLAFEQCQEAAWEQIKDRKGRIVNGVFVKEVSE